MATRQKKAGVLTVSCFILNAVPRTLPDFSLADLRGTDGQKSSLGTFALKKRMTGVPFALFFTYETVEWISIISSTGDLHSDFFGEFALFRNPYRTLNLHSSPNILSKIKLRSMRWAGHVARMTAARNGYQILVGQPEWKRPLKRSKRKWEDNIQINLKKI
jgi:hypothetical protein